MMTPNFTTRNRPAPRVPAWMLQKPARPTALPQMVTQAAQAQSSLASKAAPAILRRSGVANAGLFGASADLPDEPGAPDDYPILADNFVDPRAGQPSIDISGGGPRMGGNVPEGYGYQDPEAVDAGPSATIRGGGADYGWGQMFASVRVPGGYGPYPGFSGNPSLYDTEWSFDRELGWVPQAQAAGADQSGGERYAGGQQGFGGHGVGGGGPGGGFNYGIGGQGFGGVGNNSAGVNLGGGALKKLGTDWLQKT